MPGLLDYLGYAAQGYDQLDRRRKDDKERAEKLRMEQERLTKEEQDRELLRQIREYELGAAQRGEKEGATSRAEAARERERLRREDKTLRAYLAEQYPGVPFDLAKQRWEYETMPPRLTGYQAATLEGRKPTEGDVEALARKILGSDWQYADPAQLQAAYVQARRELGMQEPQNTSPQPGSTGQEGRFSLPQGETSFGQMTEDDKQKVKVAAAGFALGLRRIENLPPSLSPEEVEAIRRIVEAYKRSGVPDDIAALAREAFARPQ